MNSSLVSADRTTHLKIVVVSLIAAILVTAVGISSRLGETPLAAASAASDGGMVKARAVAIWAGDRASSIR